MKRALITGITGMDGSHMADFLLEKGYKVFGMERRSSTPNRLNTLHLENNENFQFVNGDLTDQNSIFNKGYDIPDDVYARIKLTGYNVAHNWPHLQQMQLTNQDRDIDVCAIYQGILNNGNSDHGLRSDVLYTKHRKGAWDELEKIEDKYNIVKGQSTPQQFVEVMKRSKSRIITIWHGRVML